MWVQDRTMQLDYERMKDEMNMKASMAKL